MTEKRFEFREVNYSAIAPRVYDTKKQQYANLFECIHWLNELNDECEFLEIENESLEDGATRYAELYHQSLKENEQLKEALKNSYMNEICENCKYGNYCLLDNYYGGFEGDFECLKKHFGNDHWKCDGLTECDELN